MIIQEHTNEYIEPCVTLAYSYHKAYSDSRLFIITETKLKITAETK